MEQTTARFPHLMAQPGREPIGHLVAAPENLERELAHIGHLRAERGRLAVEAEHLGEARAKLAGEIEGFERQRDEATRAHAERLAAGKASTLPAELATIPAEIEARNLALASIQKRQGEIGGRITGIDGSIEDAKASAWKFRAWALEAKVKDALAALQPDIIEWWAATRVAGMPDQPLTLAPAAFQGDEVKRVAREMMAEY